MQLVSMEGKGECQVERERVKVREREVIDGENKG